MTDFLAGSGSETYTPTELFAGEADVVTSPETLLSGQNLAARTVVGRVSASGKLKAFTTGASDGSQNPMGILVNAVDASSGDKACQIYVSGYFNFAALVVPGSITSAAVMNAYFDNSPIKIGSLTHSVG